MSSPALQPGTTCANCARSERGPLPEGAVRSAKQEITVSIDFVNWLHRRGLELGSATQADIDTWIATGPTTRSSAMMFVRWCIRHQHMPAQLTFPHRTPRHTPVTSDEHRYTQFADTLQHPDTPTWVQAAAVLLLVCAQPVTRIAALPLDAIATADDGQVMINFNLDPRITRGTDHHPDQTATEQEHRSQPRIPVAVPRKIARTAPKSPNHDETVAQQRN